MDSHALQRVRPTALRVRLREAVPFGLRVGVRRLPAVVGWVRDREPTLRAVTTGWAVVAHRGSPLRRPNTTYDEAVQRGKEANVRRVVELLDGVRLDPGAELSWHRVVGPPLAMRGFEPGPELHDGVLAMGAGGGACQVANLLFYLAASAGLSIVERHRHHLDLFPDHARTVPFGCGATVFYPHRDLRLRNLHAQPVAFRFAIRAGRVEGQCLAPQPFAQRWSLVEEDARFVRVGSEIWRSNTIVRVTRQGGGTLVREPLVANRARVMYSLPPDVLVESE